MKFRDSYNLPMPLKRAIEWQHSQHSVGKANISCTSLIDSPLVKYLWRVYDDQVEVEYASRLWMLFGTLMHGIVEKFGGDDEEHVERKIFAPFGDWIISGTVDYLHASKTRTLYDYKFTSLYAVSGGVKEEWEAQANVYLSLLRHSENPDDRKLSNQIDKLMLCAILRDWTVGDKEKGFPVGVKMLPINLWDDISQAKPEEIALWTDTKTINYIRERIAIHKQAQDVNDMPTQCSEKERWIKPECYAVTKKGNKKAMKLFKLKDYPSVQEAEADALNFVQQQQGKGAFDCVLRKSEPRRCMDYCDVSTFCPYRKRELEAEAGGEKTNEGW